MDRKPNVTHKKVVGALKYHDGESHFYFILETAEEQQTVFIFFKKNFLLYV